ncbi:MAG: heliorhodopsin HeR [Methanomassiliicoccales archaeon]
MEKSEEVKYKKLRKFNGAMGVLHTVQGALVLALTNDYSLPIQSNFLRFDPVTETFSQNLETVVEVPIGPLIAAFLFITAFAHFSVSTYGYAWYVRNLEKGMNPARWYEYSVTSSIMIVIIGMLSGIFDIAAILAIVAANASMNLFGLMMEKHNQHTERTDWSAFNYGTFAGALPWIAVMVYFLGAVGSGGEGPPTFVYVLIVVLLIFWITFPVNMLLQYKGVGKWRDYLYGEMGYVVLSLTSKSALAWIVFGGTLRGG